MLRLGRILGIDVSVHWSLLLLIAFAGITNGNALITAAVFGCVLLHELGHSLAARQFGINTDSIVLLPIGGIASLERMPTNPFQELWIAIAGPLVNVVIATSLLIGLWFASIDPMSTPWLLTLIATNVMLVVFNMLPAFPMDGGRVLRAILAMNMPYVNATQIAAKVGRFMAFLLGGAAIYFVKPMLLLIAVFVYFAGSAEARAVVASQVQRDWSRVFDGDSKIYRYGSPDGRRGETVQVIWDDVARKYYYAYS